MRDIESGETSHGGPSNATYSEMDAAAFEGARAPLGELPLEVNAALSALAADPARASVARSMVRALALAQQAGAKAVGVLGEGILHMRDTSGNAFVLAAPGFGAPAGAGAVEDLERLRSAIEIALGEWKFAVHLRKAIPAGFDPDPVARAVHLWRMAIDRGEWQGKHAIYEDEWVAVDLSVISREDGKAGRWMVAVPPLQASDRLTEVYQHLLGMIHRIEEARFFGPVVFAPSAEPRWGLSRGAILDVLYGVPDAISTEGGDSPAYSALFRPSGLSLFSDPACRCIHSIWWIQGDEHLSSWDGVAHENPWAQGVLQCAFPGKRFAPLDGAVPEKGATRLHWRASGS